MTETQTRAQASVQQEIERALHSLNWRTIGASDEERFQVSREQLHVWQSALQKTADLLAQEQHARQEVERQKSELLDMLATGLTGWDSQTLERVIGALKKEGREVADEITDEEMDLILSAFADDPKACTAADWKERAESAESSLSSLQEEIARLQGLCREKNAQIAKQTEYIGQLKKDLARAGRSVPEHSPERATAPTDGSGA